MLICCIGESAGSERWGTAGRDTWPGAESGVAGNKWISDRAFACGAATGCARCCGAVTRPYICLPPLRGSRELSLMNQLLIEYLPLVVFMGVALVIGLALMV